MKEIKKTLLIFQARWPEVALIVGLSTIPAILGLSTRSIKTSDKSMSNSILILSFLLFTFVLHLILMTLHCGFQRTIYLYGTRRQSPQVLLKIGAHFFWRMFGLFILVVIIYLLLFLLIFVPAADYLANNTGLPQKNVYPIFFFVTALALVKPMLFVPALIFVLDCRIIDSFRQLKYCKLSQAIEAVVLYCAPFLLNVITSLGPDIKNTQSELYYCLVVVHSCISRLLGLTVATLALRYVATLYDNHQQTEPNESDYTYPQY